MKCKVYNQEYSPTIKLPIKIEAVSTPVFIIKKNKVFNINPNTDKTTERIENA